MIRHTLIMAAGRGSRMMPLTQEIPKAMARYKDTTLISNSIAQLKKRDLSIHITVGYKGAELAKHVIEQNIASIFNTEGKGNAWWIFNTFIKYLDEPILVLTCDNVVDLDVDLLFNEYSKRKTPPCMVVPVLPVPGLEGDFIFHTSHRVTELNRNKPSDMYCSGIQILNPAQLNNICAPSDDFTHLWNDLIEKQMLYCSSVYPNPWISVDTMNQLERANFNSE